MKSKVNSDTKGIYELEAMKQTLEFNQGATPYNIDVEAATVKETTGRYETIFCHASNCSGFPPVEIIY